MLLAVSADASSVADFDEVPISVQLVAIRKQPSIVSKIRNPNASIVALAITLDSTLASRFDLVDQGRQESSE